MIRLIIRAWRWWNTPSYSACSIKLVLGILLLWSSRHAFATVMGWLYVVIAVAEAVVVYLIRKWKRELDEQS